MPARRRWTAQLQIGELEPVDVQRWRALGARSIDPNPFFEPDFLIPAARLLPRAPDRLLVIGEGDTWLACLPLRGTRLRVLTRAHQAGDANYGFLSTPLLAPEWAERSAELLVEAMAQGDDVFPLVLPYLPTSGEFAEALERSFADGTLRALERQPYERAVLIRGGQEDPVAHLSKRHQRELRRKARRLGDELGGELQCVDRAGDPEAVERFLELEAAGWKGEAGTALQSNPRHAEFFREVCERFHAFGRLQLLDLGAHGRSAAMSCNLRCDPGMYAFKIAFDERLARWGPGVALVVENAVEFNRSGLDWIDSCTTPSSDLVNRLWPHRRPMTSIVLSAQSAPLRGAVPSLALTRGLRSARRMAQGATAGR